VKNEATVLEKVVMLGVVVAMEMLRRWRRRGKRTRR